jgi:hypothetical protein
MTPCATYPIGGEDGVCSWVACRVIVLFFFFFFINLYEIMYYTVVKCTSKAAFL